MTRLKTQFVCSNCGYRTWRWQGRCPSCQTWNSLSETVADRSSGATAGAPSRRYGWHLPGPEEGPIPLTATADEVEARFPTGFSELDRVLGGGIVPGSLVLLGGDPGIGKSTLLLQVMHHVANSTGTALYVTGEESARQVQARARRLNVSSSNLFVLAETNLAVIAQTVEKLRPVVVVIDSIQTIFHPDVEGAPGSVVQVRECAAELLRLAKTSGVAFLLIGHVTKDGSLAGPRTLEHATDAVIYFEGERHYSHRVVRAVKNRFGSTNELGLFEMGDQGLKEVADPSEVFLAGRPADSTGSVVVASMEGSRPLLVEIQALLVPSPFNYPRRTVSGLDANRIAFILAVLERRAGLAVGPQDVYVKVAGGVRVDEPAADLGIALAIASSFRNRPLPRQTVVVGEVGLSGEIRAINRLEDRLREAARLGFDTCLVPAANRHRSASMDGTNLEIVGVHTVMEALEAMLG